MIQVFFFLANRKYPPTNELTNFLVKIFIFLLEKISTIQKATRVLMMLISKVTLSGNFYLFLHGFLYKLKKNVANQNYPSIFCFQTLYNWNHTVDIFIQLSVHSPLRS